MTAQQAPLRQQDNGPTDSTGQFGQLCAIVALVEQMAPEEAPHDPVPDDDTVAEAYRRAPAVARRRFDQLSREASTIASTGVQALMASDGSPQAAAELAAALRRTVDRLARLVA